MIKIELTTDSESLDLINQILFSFKSQFCENEEWNVYKLKQAGITVDQAKKIETFRLRIAAQEIINRDPSHPLFTAPIVDAMNKYFGKRQ